MSRFALSMAVVTVLLSISGCANPEQRNRQEQQQTVAKRADVAPATTKPELVVSVVTPSPPNTEAVVTVENNTPVSRIFKIDIFDLSDKTNLQGSSVFTLPAMSKTQKKVPPVEGKKFSSGVFFSYGQGPGNLESVTQRDGYRIPFEAGVVSNICQYPHGATPAIDFCVPIGTSVVAAKDGIVIGIVNHHDEGGPDQKFFDKANFVELLHTDGTRALYTHLLKDSVAVSLHAHVKRGDIIGKVGMSGQTSGPHLHFHVAKLNTSMQDDFIDPKFVTSDGRPLLFKQKYTVSQNISNPPAEELSEVAETRVKTVNKTACGQSQVTDNEKAIDCLSRGQLDAAIIHLIAHTKTNPNDSLALARLATQYTHLGRHEEAIPAYKNAIQKNWISWDFATSYAKSLFAIGQREEAIKWNMRAIKLAPDCIGCRQDLAAQLRELGRPREAIKLLQEYDESQKSRGKKVHFEGMIMLLEDDLSKSN